MRQGKGSRKVAKVRTCIFAAPWREVFLPGVWYSSYPWGRGRLTQRRKAANVRTCISFALGVSSSVLACGIRPFIGSWAHAKAQSIPKGFEWLASARGPTGFMHETAFARFDWLANPLAISVRGGGQRMPTT